MPKNNLIKTVFATLLPVAVFAVIAVQAHLPTTETTTAGMEPTQCGTNSLSTASAPALHLTASHS